MKPIRPAAKRAGFAAVALVLGLNAGMATGEVVAVVSARNPTATLSRNQVVDIFLGKTSRFPDGSQAVPIDQAEGSAAREEFYLKFAGKSPAQLNAHWSKIIFTGRGQPPREVANGVEVKKRLAENPNAIGYIEQNLVDGSVKVVLSQ
jgi:ABC-type phosphate transport system substrate-binding protein